MSESFAELFEESLKTLNLQAGAIITAIVVDIDYQSGWVTVHAGLKSEGLIPLEQFYNDAGELAINVGDEVHVALDAVEDGFGETKLSREKAKRAECWIVLEAAFAAEEVVKGVINGKVKGGFTVDVNGIRAFLPGSPGRQRAGIQGHQARPEAQQRCRFPSQRAGSREQRRARSSAGIPAGRSASQRYRQEPHRLRCVR